MNTCVYGRAVEKHKSLCDLTSYNTIISVVQKVTLRYKLSYKLPTIGHNYSYLYMRACWQNWQTAGLAAPIIGTVYNSRNCPSTQLMQKHAYRRICYMVILLQIQRLPTPSATKSTFSACALTQEEAIPGKFKAVTYSLAYLAAVFGFLWC